MSVSESVEAPKLIKVGGSGSVQAAKIGRTGARAAPRSVRRLRVAPRSDKRQSSYALLVRELSMRRFFDEMDQFSALSHANPPKYRACQQKRRFGISRCTTSCSNDATSKNNENRLQNRSKVDRSGSFGARRGAQVDRSWSFGVSRSAKVDRSGSIEARHDNPSSTHF